MPSISLCKIDPCSTFAIFPLILTVLNGSLYKGSFLKKISFGLICIIAEGRKKDKGGLSMVLITALMMKKMLAVLGMGAVAAMAAKALGVALLALLLSALIGLKKLTESNQDESSHHVQYVTAHQEHHRLRRGIDDDLPLPYRGWTPEQSNI